MHPDSTPVAGLAGLKHWRDDAAAGLQVALLWIDGVESVASVRALDKIDPWRRKSDANKRLRNMGRVFSVQKTKW